MGKTKTKRAKVPDGSPPAGAALKAAAQTLADALTPLLAAILDASDEFKRATHDLPPDRDYDQAVLLLQHVRDEWAGLSHHRDEAAALAKG